MLLVAHGAAFAQSAKVIVVTSGTTWTVPSDWNSSNNKTEVIGGGAGGAGLTKVAWATGGGRETRQEGS